MADPQSGERIHIALTFDDTFWAPAFATMRSICLYTHRRKDIVFHLCHRPLSDAHKTDFLNISQEFGSEILFYDISQSQEFVETVSSLPYNNRLTNIVYARLLLDRLLPASITKLIYLDCDMMLMAPIEDLWNTDLNGCAIGAVGDAWGPFISTGRDMRNNTDICDTADKYFNAGLLVIDMEKWRSADLRKKIVEFSQSGIMDRIYYDQGFLNIVFRDDFQSIDRRWNVMSPDPVHECLEMYNIHYAGRRKPWKLRARVAFFRVYRHVMTNELYYRYLRFRMKRRLEKLLPFLKLNRNGERKKR